METPKREIQKYFKIVIKRRYLFIILSLFIMSAFVWGSYFLPKRYGAASTVFIEHNLIKQLIKGIAITPSMADTIRVLRYAILSRGLISKVLVDLDLDTKGRNNLEEKITDYQNRTQINIKGSDLFIVSIQDPDPKLARDYINTLVRRYVEENISAKREETYGAGRFLTEQLSGLKEKLDKAEDAIIKYRQEKGIYLPADENSVIGEIKNYRGELESINVKKNELLATMNSTKRQLNGEEPFTVSVMKRSENNSIASLENRLKQLLIRYTENYPEVIKLKAEIEALKKQQASMPQKGSDNLTEPEMSTANPIYQDLRQRSLQTEVEINALDAKQKQLMAMIGARERELRNIPEGKKRLAELERERNTHRELYNKLLTMQGQSEVSKQMEIQDKSTTFRIVDPAVLSTNPVSPDRVKLILAGIFLGLLGGFGGVLIRESFDSSVKDTQTVRSLGVEILAVIPEIFNEEDHRKKMKRQKLIYAVASSYFLIICSSLVYEILDRYI